MERLDLQSPNRIPNDVEWVRARFPHCVTEASDGRLAVDFDTLRQELSEAIVDGPQERYHLNWPGKREALHTASTPIAMTLRPVRSESVSFDTTRNLFIEGDNLKALKLLQETYLGGIKMIYIDPPYNTGKDLVYCDNFASDRLSYEIASSERTKDNLRLVANPERNGRIHSNWLTMMLPRLKLARNLLATDGAIFVSCDENEHPRLRLVMDELYGQSNFVADFVWVAGFKNDSTLVSVSHEYIVCYARDRDFLRERKVRWTQRKKGLEDIHGQHRRLMKRHGERFDEIETALAKWYRSLPDNNPAKRLSRFNKVDRRGVYTKADISWPGGGGPKYDVLHPVTGRPVKIPSRGWMTGNRDTMQQWIDKGRVHFGADETSVPSMKLYLRDREFGPPFSVFYQPGTSARRRLRALMGSDVFDFPKDETVLQDLVELLTEDGDTVLDFFAGSSTTAHAVLARNAVDGGNRRFIMVQLDEDTAKKSAARTAGYQSIAELSRERIRRAGKLILGGPCHPDWNRDVGFRMLRIDSSNVRDVFYEPDRIPQSGLLDFVDHVKPDRSAEDLLFQVLVDWGVDLTLPVTRKRMGGG